MTRAMSRAERTALADAIRHMRKSGIAPRDMIASGVPARLINRDVHVTLPGTIKRVVR